MTIQNWVGAVLIVVYPILLYLWGRPDRPKHPRKVLKITSILFICISLTLIASACRGSILNPYKETCTVTGVDTIPVVWPSGDTTSAVVTTSWCEWKLEQDETIEFLTEEPSIVPARPHLGGTATASGGTGGHRGGEGSGTVPEGTP